MKKRLIAFLVVWIVSIMLVGCGLPEEIDGPLSIVDVWMEYTILGDPEIHMKVENVGTKPVKAFTMEAKFWDAYGNRLKAFGFGEDVYKGIAQNKIIDPGQTYSCYWVCYYETAYTAEVTLTSTVDTSDHKWFRSTGDGRYVRTITRPTI